MVISAKIRFLIFNVIYFKFFKKLFENDELINDFISEKWTLAEPILTKFDRHNRNYKPQLSLTSEMTF